MPPSNDITGKVPCWTDLSQPDNSEYIKEKSSLVWAIWHFFGSPIVESSWLPFSSLKCFVLKLFGANIGKRVYIKPGVKVKFPWLLTIGDYCWIGERAWIDNLAQVTIGSHVCISQDAYLCTGNHDWSVPNMKLFRRPVVLEDGCWVGARSTVCPGTTLQVGAVVTAGSVVSKIVPPYEIWAGNPAHFWRKRANAKILHAHSSP